MGGSFMDIVIEQINSVGKMFVEFAWPMLWQSGVLIAILLGADWLLRRRVRAVFRYWLWMLVLAKLFLPTTLSSPVSIGLLTGNALPAINIAATEQPVGGDISNVLPHSPRTAETAEASAALHTEAPIQSQAITPVASLTREGGIFLAWLMVVCAMLLLLMQRAVFVCGLVRQSAEATDLMKDALKFCCNQMGVRQTIGLKISPNATSPAVCGLFRPVILVPQGLGSSLGIGSLRVVLMHELAHIKRGDLWVNLLQTVLQIAYFYNPLLWLANWMIRRVREQAVDEAVQVALGERAHQYPETLLNVARLAFERPALSLRLIGVVESKSALTSRIKRMLTRPIPKTAKLGIIGSLAIIFFAAVLLPMAKGMANKPKESTAIGEIIKNESGKVTYRVDDKITLEILGITNWPVAVDSKWWGADGTILKEAPLDQTEINRIAEMRSFGENDGWQRFIVVAHSEAPAGTTIIFTAKSLGRAKVTVPANSVTENKSAYIVSVAGNKTEANSIALAAKLADGVWQTAEKIYIGGNAGTTKAGMTYTTTTTTDAMGEKTGVVLNATKNLSGPGVDTRIAAIDKKGGVFTQTFSNAVSAEGLYTYQLTFELSRNDIDHLELQHRPFTVYEFHNVSFEPGRGGDVTVKLASTDRVPSYTIDFEIVEPQFPEGDLIEITEIVGTAKTLRPGERYIVRGRYKLGSRDKARLHLYATNGETQCQQGPDVGRGEGDFVRTFDYLKEGGLHLSFYPAEGGSSFGGVYFTDKGSEVIARKTTYDTFRAGDGVDVAVENFDIRPYPEGGLYTLTVSIRNRGGAESPKFRVTFYRGDPDEVKPMTHEAGPIKPGDMWNEGSMPFALKEGANEIAVSLDPDNTLGESDRTNNEASIKIVVKDGKIVEKKVSLSSAKGISKETTGISDQVISAAEFGEKPASDMLNEEQKLYMDWTQE
jgi:bla regulator protein BlaR1